MQIPPLKMEKSPAASRAQRTTYTATAMMVVNSTSQPAAAPPRAVQPHGSCEQERYQRYLTPKTPKTQSNHVTQKTQANERKDRKKLESY